MSLSPRTSRRAAFAHCTPDRAAGASTPPASRLLVGAAALLATALLAACSGTGGGPGAANTASAGDAEASEGNTAGSTDTESAGEANSGDAAGEQEPVTLRFTWWGSDTRAALTQEAIEAFQQEYPHITIQGEPTAFDGYFDKLSTAFAGGDAPDVFTLGGSYPAEYAARGVLLDLGTASGLDLSPFDEAILANAMYEGNLYGVPTGANTVGIIANPRLFAEAGLEMPDDDTWTWEEFADIAATIAANTDAEGFEPRFHDYNRIWFAQHGDPLYTAEGTLGADPDVLTEYWEWILALRDAGGIPPADLLTEVISAGPEQTLLGQGRAAMQATYSNQLSTLAGSSGDDLVLLRFPGETEFERTGMTLLPSQFFAIASGTEHPQEAALFVDWLVNSTEAGTILGSDRGMPSNAAVRDAIAASMDQFEQAELEFIGRVQEASGEALPPQPEGASIANDLTIRMQSEVLFDRLTPEQATEQWMTDMRNALGG